MNLSSGCTTAGATSSLEVGILGLRSHQGSKMNFEKLDIFLHRRREIQHGGHLSRLKPVTSPSQAIAAESGHIASSHARVKLGAQPPLWIAPQPARRYLLHRTDRHAAQPSRTEEHEKLRQLAATLSQELAATVDRFLRAQALWMSLLWILGSALTPRIHRPMLLRCPGQESAA